MGFSYVLVTGLQILCSRAVGSGDSRQVVSMFSAGFIFLAVCGAVISVLCVLFPEPLIVTEGGLTRGGNNTSVVLNLITSASYVLAFLYVLLRFMDKYSAVHIELGNLCLSRLGETAILGLPSLMFTLGCTVSVMLFIMSGAY